MKNIIAVIAAVLIVAGITYATVSNPVKPYTFSAGQTASSASVNADFDTIYSAIGDTNAALNDVLTGTTTVPLASTSATAMNANKFGGYSAASYRSASNLSAGTLPDARFPATLPAANGSNLTALNATQLTSGTVPAARLSGKNTIKGWATFNGKGVGDLHATSFHNISTVVRFAAGAYGVNIPSGLMANANYSYSIFCYVSTPAGVTGSCRQPGYVKTPTKFEFNTWIWDTTPGGPAVSIDCDELSVMLFGE